MNWLIYQSSSFHVLHCYFSKYLDEFSKVCREGSISVISCDSGCEEHIFSSLISWSKLKKYSVGKWLKFFVPITAWAVNYVCPWYSRLNLNLKHSHHISLVQQITLKPSIFIVGNHIILKHGLSKTISAPSSVCFYNTPQ